MNLALYGLGPGRTTANGSSSTAASPFPARTCRASTSSAPTSRFIEENRAQPGRHRHHPCARGPLRRPARPVAAAEGPVLDDAVLGRPARGQAPVRARRAEGAGHHLPRGRDLPGRARSTSRFIAVTHSIPEPVSLAITTPLGTVVHTGDWKIDPTPEIGLPTNETRFRALGDKGVLALICDSDQRHARGQSSPSERGRRREACDADRARRRGRVAITTFSSNVGRIRSIAEAARAAGRQVVVLGRSMKRVIDVAGELGCSTACRRSSREEDYGYIPRDNLVIICTGSQGEPRAALAKLSRDEMKSVALSPGDTVIFSSRTIPGNEKAILEIKNRLIDQGVRILEDGDALVHVSGHPRRAELVQMYQWTRPQIGVPVHGEAAHLVAQGALGRMEGIPEVAQVRNGDVLRLAPGPAEVIDEAPFGRVYKDGKLIGDWTRPWASAIAASCPSPATSPSMSCSTIATRSPAIPTSSPSAWRRRTRRANRSRTSCSTPRSAPSRAFRGRGERISISSRKQSAAPSGPRPTTPGARSRSGHGVRRPDRGLRAGNGACATGRWWRRRGRNGDLTTGGASRRLRAGVRRHLGFGIHLTMRNSTCSDASTTSPSPCRTSPPPPPSIARRWAPR